jgi:class 3 adenylate cyclase
MDSGETKPSSELERPEQAPDNGSPEGRARRLRKLALRLDQQPSLLTAAGRLRRSLPGDERFGDALSTAGSRPAEVVGRGLSALQPDRRSVAQELGLAGLQVWQSLSEATGRGRGDQEMAILFTDLVGFSAWALRAGDNATLELLREVATVLEEAVTENQGRIVKRLGDGIMATFLDPGAAVAAALDAQEAIAGINLDGHTPRMRAGVHWGSPRKLGGDYLGVDVNIAARVGDAAKADQVLVSTRLLARLDTTHLKAGRAKRLRADGAPRDLQVAPISRRSDGD